MFQTWSDPLYPLPLACIQKHFDVEKKNNVNLLIDILLLLFRDLRKTSMMETK